MPKGIYQRKKRVIPVWNKGKKMINFPQCGFQNGHPFYPGTPTLFKKGEHSFTEYKKGHLVWNKGKLYPQISGEKHWNWQGGKSLQLYAINWTDDLRESIRKRDDYICQICGIHQDELNSRFKKLDVHHIDYDKKNLNPNNLIILCKYCHSKTNYNRDYWINYFLNG